MDLIDRQQAIRLVHSVLYEMRVDAAAAEIEKPMSKEDKLLLRVNKVVCTKLKELPSVEPEMSHIEQELHGKTPEEQYDFIYWLLMKSALNYSNSRLAILEWLGGEKEDE